MAQCQDSTRRDANTLCLWCSTPFYARPCDLRAGKNRYCSRACAGQARTGPSSPTWKGGRVLKSGYAYIKVPGHPNTKKDGYVAEHRLVMSTVLGRPILTQEHVHHKDGNTLNNDPANLEVLDSRAHTARHKEERRASGRWSRRYGCCIECGTAARPYYCKGLCKRCYARLWYQARLALTAPATVD